MLSFRALSAAARIRNPSNFSPNFIPALSYLQTRCYASKKKAKEVKVDPNALPLVEAVNILQAVEVGNPNHKLEIHVQCKIEKSTPPIRGSVILPNSLTQDVTILVFAEGAKAEEAKAAGAQIVGGRELIEQIQNGILKFDKCISTPGMYPAVLGIARILGPKNLMPSVKKGTVTDDIAQVVRMSSSAFDFKADKEGVLHTGIAKVSFSAEQVEANVRAILDEIKSFGKAQSIRGIIQNVYVSSTRGPGIPLSDALRL